MKNKVRERSVLQYKIKYATSSIIKYLTLILGVAVAIIPILVIFLSSIKTKKDYDTGGVLSLPTSITFQHYIDAFTKGNMLSGFKNTFFILVVVIVAKIVLGAAAAYVLHRFRFKGKIFIMTAFLMATFVPGIVNNIIVYQIISAIGLFNTLGAVMLLGIGTDVISMYIFLQFLDSIPASLDESAMLDGASYFTIFRTIIFPLLKPAIATVGILQGVALYNDFYTPYLYMPDPGLSTIATALYRFKGPNGSDWQIIAAGVMIIIIPTLIVFLALQKHIYNGIQGSVK
ncbi:carbohydrate ABC transporter permease [Clostridium akagii]|uniref:carbohydrate ABC transporter permease n=1 Tax=Clostridium akagii TaxID=91623 RepID=UPI00068D0997|nr:carbohydrate ABC transporter permease [Clostridium akagii]